MDSASRYRRLGNPGRSEHLWRYTPWKRVHPSGKIEEIPEMGKPILSLSHIDGSEVSEGISLRNGIEGSDLFFGDELTNTFLDATSIDSRWTLEIEKSYNSDKPVVLDITPGNGSSAAHIHLDVGAMSNIELVTRISGSSEWIGLQRSGRINDGAIFNEVVLCLQERGTVLRSDSIQIGKDSQVRAGTVSSGSEQTKADLRFRMTDIGGNIRILGSILSAESMHLDHHVEIHHDAPQTFSRLSWHSACGGNSRTIGTGMLRVSHGSIGADAGQIFHNLLLSERAEADSIPELEVMEHDVIGCGHGTANGPIDEDQLFYLESRGFSSQDAKKALIAAFLNSTLSEMGSQSLHEWLVAILTSKLETLEA